MADLGFAGDIERDADLRHDVVLAPFARTEAGFGRLALLEMNCTFIRDSLKRG